MSNFKTGETGGSPTGGEPLPPGLAGGGYLDLCPLSALVSLASSPLLYPAVETLSRAILFPLYFPFLVEAILERVKDEEGNVEHVTDHPSRKLTCRPEREA